LNWQVVLSTSESCSISNFSTDQSISSKVVGFYVISILSFAAASSTRSMAARPHNSCLINLHPNHWKNKKAMFTASAQRGILIALTFSFHFPKLFLYYFLIMWSVCISTGG